VLADSTEDLGRPSSTTSRSVSIQGDVVVKLQNPETSRRERLRTTAARVVGQETGLFSVPKIISFDDNRGSIIFERLPGVVLQQALLNDNKSLDVIGSVARALAAIHGRMEPSVTPLDSPRAVPLHGDFGATNVLCRADSDRIAVLDWSNASWIGYDADMGSPEIDVSVFLISLFHRRVFGRRPLVGRRDLARHFLTTYESASPHGVDVPTLRRIVASTSPAFIQMTRRLRGSFRAVAYRHSLVDLDFFLRRLPRGGGI
jgi:tRNA A-37 threonylcarbamoyl transferase component Bud32